ncbi:uncharacterized protein L969DRAFT_93199 [Mixia osmundae IAM 14324]|uniref:C3H1-type domain-containing protein n=1 Tax=Mixia osmundae (strain CBS 9802 / IAM 14324 / JCM 22182 / KY 12970) TaxID=764103 RepID=G7E5T3_MIXOS|nr:uncharacterized protein L969DRAFT_93199 [Mixia osmundae IAM 14324]KEI40655.1 hypothetical protein L969DRAFT_93199 [Mixia osmundae IAM 14324]GAA98193.1 hypothetical protein E5Q_04876 [Mixia osmundae IAM 14324]
MSLFGAIGDRSPVLQHRPFFHDYITSAGISPVTSPTVPSMPHRATNGPVTHADLPTPLPAAPQDLAEHYHSAHKRTFSLPTEPARIQAHETDPMVTAPILSQPVPGRTLIGTSPPGLTRHPSMTWPARLMTPPDSPISKKAALAPLVGLQYDDPWTAVEVLLEENMKLHLRLDSARKAVKECEDQVETRDKRLEIVERAYMQLEDEFVRLKEGHALYYILIDLETHPFSPALMSAPGEAVEKLLHDLEASSAITRGARAVFIFLANLYDPAPLVLPFIEALRVTHINHTLLIDRPLEHDALQGLYKNWIETWASTPSVQGVILAVGLADETTQHLADHMDKIFSLSDNFAADDRMARIELDGVFAISSPIEPSEHEVSDAASVIEEAADEPDQVTQTVRVIVKGVVPGMDSFCTPRSRSKGRSNSKADRARQSKSLCKSPIGSWTTIKTKSLQYEENDVPKIDSTKQLTKQTVPPCNNFYLTKEGCYNKRCTYEHRYRLTDKQLHQMRTGAKNAVCANMRQTKSCSAGDDCIFGHKCPRGKKCDNLASCPFSLAGMH